MPAEPAPRDDPASQPRLAAVLAAPAETGSFVTAARAELTVDLGGIPGDRHHGLTRTAGVRESHHPKGAEIRNRRALTAVAPDELAAIAACLGLAAMAPEWLGANLVVDGVDSLTRLPVGTLLQAPDGATLVCEGHNPPCRKPGEVVAAAHPDHAGGLAAAFVKAAVGRRGVLLSVERGGTLRAGDALTVRAPPEAPAPLLTP